MVKTHNRIIAGALSVVFIGQVMLFGDGTAKGILHPDTIASAVETVEKMKSEKELAEEFEKATKGIGAIDYFDVASDSATTNYIRTTPFSAMNTIPNSVTVSFPEVSNSLTVSGTVTSFENCAVSNAKVILFDADWNNMGETTVASNGEFSVTASGFSSTATHVKIEYNGFCPDSIGT